MRCHVELYNQCGAMVASFGCHDPIDGLSRLAQRAQELNRVFDYVTASCYLNQIEQWFVEIK